MYYLSLHNKSPPDDLIIKSPCVMSQCLWLSNLRVSLQGGFIWGCPIKLVRDFGWACCGLMGGGGQTSRVADSHGWPRVPLYKATTQGHLSICRGIGTGFHQSVQFKRTKQKQRSFRTQTQESSTITSSILFWSHSLDSMWEGTTQRHDHQEVRTVKGHLGGWIPQSII